MKDISASSFNLPDAIAQLRNSGQRHSNHSGPQMVRPNVFGGLTHFAWQAHTIRGFVSILASKGGQKITSSKNAAGERTYRIAKML